LLAREEDIRLGEGAAGCQEGHQGQASQYTHMQSS